VQIVTAARELFSTRGIDVPLEEIAQLAGIGIATLYRRFPTRQALIEEIFIERIELAASAAEEALGAADAWDGFCSYVVHLCQMQAEDCGLRDVLMMTFPAARDLELARRNGHALSTRVIERAQRAGTLRPDFSPEDLMYLLLANGTFVAATETIDREAWLRYVALFLDGCRAGNPPLPTGPLTARQMYRAMSTLSAAGRRSRGE
jgi:AcrR family transcriptional regulator